MRTKIEVDRNFLESVQHLTYKEISKILNCCEDTVFYIMRRHGMPPRQQVEDLSGQKFGKWEVLYRDANRGNATYWVCRCACGVEKSVNAGSLKGSKKRLGSQSCKSRAQWQGYATVQEKPKEIS